jgi:hypothetical protein
MNLSLSRDACARAFVAIVLALSFAFNAPAIVSPAAGADALSGLLPKTQSNVEKFVEDFALLRYEEDVVQQKLKNNDKVAYKQETIFDSLIRMHYEEGKLRVDEQRLPEKLPRKPESRPLLNTYGFSVLAMVFHPYYASSFRFTEIENDSLQGQSFARIHFEHIPGQPSPVLYQMLGADKPLELAGTAWVDPVNGDIHRMEATLGVDSNGFGLKSIRAEVSYRPVLLKGDTEPRLLPVLATIDLETARQHWRNIHHFTDQRQYRVSMNLPGASAQ